MHPSKELYQEYCVECRWKGQRPLTWNEWLADDPYHSKAAAQERAAQLHDTDTWDLY